MKYLALLLLFYFPQLNAGTVIEFWTKADSRTKQVKKTLDLSHFQFEDMTVYDFNYKQKTRYHGFQLRDLVSAMNLDPKIDLAILHFANGMIVPVTIKELRDNNRIAIALKIYRDGKWQRDFPTAFRPNDGTAGGFPIKFSGNKVLPGPAYLKDKDEMNPWLFVDSLAGIELVQSKAYLEQFRNKDADETVLNGRVVYLRRCQFCHAVRGVGGSYGIDFVDPVSISQIKSTRQLHKHVTAERPEHLKDRLRMPEQTDFSVKESAELLRWVKALEKGDMKGYRPE